MPTVQVPAQLTVEHIVAAVKQLSPEALVEFKRLFDQWQGENASNWSPMDQAELMAIVEENSRLPADKQNRFEQLRRKLARATLTQRDHPEYLELLHELEARNVKRMEALVTLAKQRGQPLSAAMEELGIDKNADAI